MEKSCCVAASGRGGAAESREQQRPASLGKKKMKPRAPETTQPKTMSFWVGLIFFFINQNTPKRRPFGVIVLKKKIRTP